MPQEYLCSKLAQQITSMFRPRNLFFFEEDPSSCQVDIYLSAHPWRQAANFLAMISIPRSASLSYCQKIMQHAFWWWHIQISEFQLSYLSTFCTFVVCCNFFKL